MNVDSPGQPVALIVVDSLEIYRVITDMKANPIPLNLSGIFETYLEVEFSVCLYGQKPRFEKNACSRGHLVHLFILGG